MRQRMSAAHRPRPPLAEARDLGVVRGHVAVDLDDRIARKAEPHAEVRFLAGDRLFVEPSDFPQRGNPGRHDSTEAVHILDRTRRAAPFNRAETIVDRSVGVALGKMAGDDRAVGMLRERFQRC